MKTFQFDRIYSEYCRFNRDDIHKTLYITEGKYKGKKANLRYFISKNMIVLVEGEQEEISLHYTKLEEFDEYGEVKIFPVIDMTGREINLDSYVCYSLVSNQTHALEIGRVFEITRIGAVKVNVVVHNGKKIKSNSYRNNTTIINNPFRSIKLPVDTPELLMWMLNDFEDLTN
jgi:hypothetical protein